MKTAWRLTFAMMIALALAACQTTPETDTTPTDTDTTPTDVDTSAAPDPHDYTDSRNFDNPESLLSKRVIYFDLTSPLCARNTAVSFLRMLRMQRLTPPPA